MALAYIFKHSDRNDLILFGHFKTISVCDLTMTKLNNPQVLGPSIGRTAAC